MPRMSSAEFLAYQIAHPVKGHAIELPTVGGCDEESELHKDILEYCKANRWIALHGAMYKHTSRNLGEWDFTILLDSGRVRFIEAKTAKGKLSTEQLGMQKWASMLGHTIYVVRSFKEFLEVVL